MKEKYYWMLFGILGIFVFLMIGLPPTEQNLAIFNLKVTGTGISYVLVILGVIKIAQKRGDLDFGANYYSL